MSYDSPFEGLKIIDLSQGIAGPYCAMLLAQNGANVIKIEPTGAGDWSRGLGRVYGDNTAFSVPGNLGKRSVALDLKSDDGRAVLWRLIRHADVFIEGFRPGVIKRLGFGYEAVSAAEPRILYLSISGFGQTGPFAERPAMDPVLQAFTGLTLENKGEDGIPHRVPIIPIDMTTALFAFQAISSALFARQGETHGRHIDASLMQGAAGLQVVRMMGSYMEGGEVSGGAAPSGIYQAADGWINITVVRPFEWVGLCEKVIDRPDLPKDTRFIDRDARWTNQEALFAIVRPIIASRSFAEWTQLLTGAQLMHERLNTYSEFLQQDHVRATNAIAWLNQPGVPRPMPMPNIIGRPPLQDGTPRAHAPTLGEHTEIVLREHGYSETDIQGLASRRVVTGVRQTEPI
jgi:crotonobetainyl-CoA:carnitine CoA-transferase CaiB-like acyl-CoA transferase